MESIVTDIFVDSLIKRLIFLQMNEMIFPIYDDLISFASTLKEENLEMFKTKRVTKGTLHDFREGPFAVYVELFLLIPDE